MNGIKVKISTAIQVLVLVVSITGGYTLLKSTANTTRKDVDDIKVEIKEKIKPKLDSHDTAIAIINTKLDMILEILKELKRK